MISSFHDTWEIRFFDLIYVLEWENIYSTLMDELCWQ